ATSSFRRAALVRHRLAQSSVKDTSRNREAGLAALISFTQEEIERSMIMGIARFIVGLLTFVIGVVVVKFVLALIGVVLHLFLIGLVLCFFALIGWIVYKIIFPSQPANA